MELDERYDHYDYPTKAPVAKDGHPGYLTEAQQAQVHQLRMMLESEGCTKRLDTLTLLRFLRARNWNVEAAKEMFMKAEDWRKKTDLDTKVLDWTYPEKKRVFEFYPQYYHKTDKDGRPLYIEKLGKVNLPKIEEITTKEKMLLNLAVEYERLADQRLPACSRMSGHLLETCCTIMDMKDVGLTQCGSKVTGFISEASAISQNYYPERLGRLYVINIPYIVRPFLNFIKNKFLDPITAGKIQILGSEYKQELLKHVPIENLPEEFGGTCKCEDGCQFSDMGPWRMKEWARPADWEKEHGSQDALRPTPPDVEKEASPSDVEKEAVPTEVSAAA